MRSGTVTAPEGLHARPAAAFVRAVSGTGLPVIIRKTGSAALADARSLLEVMAADFANGCRVDLIVNDGVLGSPAALEKAALALDGLVELLESQGSPDSQ